MTDSEIAALRTDHVVVDCAGQEWRVVHEPREEAGMAWVMIRNDDQALRLSYRNAGGFHLQTAAAG
jgi:hypothetical protein